MANLPLNLDIDEWIPDSSGLWQVIPTEDSPMVPLYISGRGVGITINAQASESSDPASLPFIEQPFTPPLALRRTGGDGTNAAAFFRELRFWLRSSRVGNGQTPRQGFYLSFEVANDDLGLSQEWFIPVKQANTWELHRLWLGDLPEPLLQAITTLRFRALDNAQRFQAVLGDVIVTTPEPIQDGDTELLNRLDGRFEVAIQDTPTLVPAFLELPENPGSRTPPYILITPWSVQLQRERGGSGEIADNYRVSPTGETFEVAQRPAMKQVVLEYAIDVFAENRLQKAQLLDSVLADFSRQLYLVVNLEPLTLSSFNPAPERATEFAIPGRTPLYLQVTVDIEAGDRQFTTLAERPQLQFNQLDKDGQPVVTEPETVLI